jgi:hypothetical protein
MNRFFALVVAVLLLPGCISSKKYASYISAYYKKSDTATASAPPAIPVTLRTPSSFDSVANVTKGESYFIPAIFYWGAKQSFHCEMNADIPAGVVSKTFNKYAETDGLNKKLNGRRLELTIDALPTRFFYSQNTDVIFILIYAVTMGKQSILPENTSLAITYKIYDGQQLVKEGKLEAKDENQPLNNIAKSTRKITVAYLRQYTQSVTQMSQQCLSQLVAEL